MTNTQKALELFNTFANSDTKKAASLLAEGYIQHNLAYSTGRDAFIGSVACLASAPINYSIRRFLSFSSMRIAVNGLTFQKSRLSDW